MRKIEEPKELTDEQREAIEERDNQIELFERFEFPLFIQDMELHGDLEPEQTMQALNAIFWYGFSGAGIEGEFRGRFPVESAYELYNAIDAGKITASGVAYLLKKKLENTTDEIPF